MGFVYILKLRGDRYYIGSTRNLEERLQSHICADGYGAKYTLAHSVVDIVDVKPTDNLLQLEKAIYVLYAVKYGWESVRGSSWCQVDQQKPPGWWDPSGLRLLARHGPPERKRVKKSDDINGDSGATAQDAPTPGDISRGGDQATM